MKRFLPLALVLVLLFSLLAVGCADKAADPASVPPVTTPPADPVVDKSLLGSFSTHDLAGNIVTPELFEGHDLTMINVWATYCGPCINEMPDLGAISREYADQGFQIVGLIVDIQDRTGKILPDGLELALEIVDETGAGYTHIVPVAEMYGGALGGVNAVPTTFFVNSEGVQVGETYIGSRSKDAWVAIIDGLLARG